MKRLLLTLIYCLLNQGCGHHQNAMYYRAVDPELDPIVKSFEATLGFQVTLVVQFGQVPQISAQGYETVGICQFNSDGSRTITIDKTFFEGSSPNAQQDLIYHELGHCELGRQHTTATFGDGTPASIMNPYIFDDSAHQQELIAELFANKEYVFNAP